MKAKEKNSKHASQAIEQASGWSPQPKRGIVANSLLTIFSASKQKEKRTQGTHFPLGVRRSYHFESKIEGTSVIAR